MPKKKIIFLPFINAVLGFENNKPVTWRTQLEKAFMGKCGDNETINEIRKRRPKVKSREEEYTDENKAAFRDYYAELHAAKSVRQEKWLRFLSGEVAVRLEQKVKMEAQKKGFDGSIVVAALPEFFWYDINDNQKHEWSDDREKFSDFIDHYHKPLYRPTFDFLLSPDNPLAELTDRIPNLIIFGGTALWKEINENNHYNEKIFNTLVVYHSGKVDKIWSKHYFSPEDGFSGKKANKKGEIGMPGDIATVDLNLPLTVFHDITFVYDICYDFVMGTGEQPISSVMCRQEKTDVNVLIAAGMRLSAEDMQKILSPVILRCDGLHAPYGQIAKKGEDPGNVDITNAITNAITDKTEFGVLETEIDTDSQNEQGGSGCIIQ